MSENNNPMLDTGYYSFIRLKREYEACIKELIKNLNRISYLENLNKEKDKHIEDLETELSLLREGIRSNGV